MAVFQKTILVKTKKLHEFVELTEDIEEAAKESKIKNGVVFANALHNTAALIIQENDPSVHKDLINVLEKLFPMGAKYEHDYEGNENATAHLKSNFLGTFVTIPLTGGKLNLGTWQSIFIVELFEPRTRKIVVTIIGE
jgi:secondary thiamine-phosphate synthase enzyme